MTGDKIGYGERMDPNHEDKPFADILTSGELVAFDAADMTACAECGRSNPPNRTNCIYCGKAFDVGSYDASRVNVAGRLLENWERGFNVVAVSSDGPRSDDAVVAVAKNVAADPEVLLAALNGSPALPIARVESEVEARIVIANLGRLGLEAISVADTVLSAKPPVRCRSLIFDGPQLTFVPFNAGTPATLTAEAIEVIVAGTLLETKTEATAQRKGRKSTTETGSVATSEMPVIDIYYKGNDHGLRINAAGFDFSCLGAEKVYVAAANLKLLLKRLENFAVEAKFVRDYDERRKLLDLVWYKDERTESLGLKRSGLGRTAIANVTTCSNLSQFSKYSRLQKYLYDQEKTRSSNG